MTLAVPPIHKWVVGSELLAMLSASPQANESASSQIPIIPITMPHFGDF
jgi:hypothetical protein